MLKRWARTAVISSQPGPLIKMWFHGTRSILYRNCQKIHLTASLLFLKEIIATLQLGKALHALCEMHSTPPRPSPNGEGANTPSHIVPLWDLGRGRGLGLFVRRRPSTLLGEVLREVSPWRHATHPRRVTEGADRAETWTTVLHAICETHVQSSCRCHTPATSECDYMNTTRTKIARRRIAQNSPKPPNKAGGR
jgi:hypothetical protein